MMKSEKVRLLPQRSISRETISVAKCVAKIIKWHIIEVLKFGLMPLRVGNYYLIKAEGLDGLFQKLDKNSIQQAEKR